MVTRVLIMAGGTGGHVFPALAVADELRARGVEVVWLGTRAGLEADIVPAAGIAMEWITIRGLRGKGWLSWLLAPLRIGVAMVQTLIVIMQRRPMAVLGMGGFVTGPGGLVSWLLRKPLLIHEQNAVAGMTNRLLAPLASRVMAAFPGLLSKRSNAVITGNPVRAAIAGLPAPDQRFAGRGGALRLLVLGGSLGAEALNAAVPEALKTMAVAVRPQVWHQAGKQNAERTRARYHEHAVAGRVDPFITDMAEAYGWADLVICRAGALTVAELAAAGIASILVPYPSAVDDHQTRNAAYLVDAGAALLLPQSKLNATTLAKLLGQFCGIAHNGDAGTLVSAWPEQGRRRLQEMADAARRLARPDAAAHVAALCLEAAHA